MVKKAVLSLVLLTVFGAAVFAEYYNGYTYSCAYAGSNTSSAQLAIWAAKVPETAPHLNHISKLSNSVSQVITHALEDYTLAVGDRFGIGIFPPGGMMYYVVLRITSTNGAYEYFAFYGPSL